MGGTKCLILITMQQRPTSNNLISGIVLIAAVVAIAAYMGIPATGQRFLSRGEKRIIHKSGNVMYVLDVADREDSLVLRKKSYDFTDWQLKSSEFTTLANKMLATVQSEQQGGVGIAGPQVGISHRVIAVCRMDKADEPYEIYPNIHIDSLYGEVTLGPEGCLSVAPMRGNVPRYSDVVISYKDPSTLKTETEHISGYTAIIFQHECDHLDGILYTDRADSVYVNDSWVEDRRAYAEKGLYDKPEWLARTISKIAGR